MQRLSDLQLNILMYVWPELCSRNNVAVEFSTGRVTWAILEPSTLQQKKNNGISRYPRISWVQDVMPQNDIGLAGIYIVYFIGFTPV